MNRNFLAIDCGNSRIKASILEPSGRVGERRIFGYDEPEGLIEWMTTRQISRGAMASVHTLDTRLVESIRKVMGDDFLLITPHTDLGIRIDYADPARLGIDRKVGAVGASVLFPGQRLLVVDAGTAVTMDLIGADGGFEEGSISPGISLRLESLSRGTYLLPRPALPENLAEIRGNSTEGCILLGVLGGLLDEIGMAMMRAREKGAARAVICGGDGDWICSNLGRRFGNLDLEYNYAPDLLAVGMREIYRRQS